MRLGRYRHFKGKLYEALGVARHSETLEQLVVYKALYPNKLGRLWVRPKAMFLGLTVHEGKKVRRFTHLGAK